MLEISYENKRGEVIKFTSGQYEFSDTIDKSVKGHDGIRLVGFEGFGETNADIQSQKAPFQDGSTRLDSILDNKHPYMELVLTARNSDELSSLRKLTSSVLNPKIEGVFCVKTNGKKYTLEVIPEHLPVYSIEGSDALGKVQSSSINFISNNPYWQSEAVSEEPAFSPLFEFPFEGEFELGLQRVERIIDNDGDAPTPLKVVFNGPAQRPTITNVTTGEFIKINKDLGENETVIIDTSDDEKSLIYVDEHGNETNVFNWIDLDSTFFKLGVGENEITCSCSTSSKFKDFEIYYQKLYVGV